MKDIFFTGTIIYICCVFISAEIIPSSKIINWDSGIPEGIPQIEGPVENVMDHGAIANGTSDDFPAFQSAIEALTGGGVVFVPEGEYLISNTLLFEHDSLVLRGEGTGKTRLYFDINSIPCIEIITYQRGTFVDILSGLTKGSKTVTVSDASEFVAGGFAEIQQDNDSVVMYTSSEWNQSWSEKSVGQILVVESIHGNDITFTKELYLSYKSELHPQIRPQGFIKYCGVENLYLERMNSDGDDYTIYLKNAAYIWVVGVESYHTMKGHIYGNTLYGCMFMNNYFHHSFDYGGSGHGYGIDLGFHCTDNLIENNIFYHLRHAMLVQLGASGNVFAYNYSTGTRQGAGETDLNEGWLAPDISVHGHYANNNLFEGNTVEQIGIADYWGPAGPGMVYARNRIVNSEIRSDGKTEDGAICIDDGSNYQYLIGNDVIFGEILMEEHDGLLPPERSTLIIHGNRINGVVEWESDISVHEIPKSYYLDCQPEFLQAKSWPVIGTDVSSDATIPAQDRYEGSDKIAQDHSRECVAGIYAPRNKNRHNVNSGIIDIYIRANTLTLIAKRSGKATLELYSLNGRMLYSQTLFLKELSINSFRISNLVPMPGLYILKISGPGFGKKNIIKILN